MARAKTNLPPIGKRLRKLQIDYEQTTTEMAADLGFTDSYLRRVITGKIRPSLKFIKAITDRYNLSKEDEEAIEADFAEQDELRRFFFSTKNKLEIKIFSFLRQNELTDEKRHQIIGILYSGLYSGADSSDNADDGGELPEGAQWNLGNDGVASEIDEDEVPF